jgi:hypothetical protein
MENLIIKKSVKFTDKGVEGHIKLQDGTKTYFKVDTDGEYKQWGDNPNESITTPVITKLLEMLYSDD